MATTVRTPATKAPAKGAPMSSTRKTALVAGVFYLITFISIPTLALYGPVADQAALHGLLQKIRDLGLPLISVNHVGPGHPPVPAGAR